MNKKTIIAFLVIAATLICGIAVSVFLLYRDVETIDRGDAAEMKKDKKIREKVSKTVSSDADVLKAVPSDAVGVFSFNSLEEAVNVLSDDSRILKALVTTTGKYSLDKYISILATKGIPQEMKNARTAVSLHYSGSLSALLIVDCADRPDSCEALVEMLSRAQSIGLRSKIAGIGGNNLLLVSASEADIVSSLKHIDAKASILDARSFSRTLAKEGRDGRLFLCGNAVNKVMPSLLASTYAAKAGFLSTVSEWMVLEIGEGAYGLGTAGSKGASYFENVLAELPAAVCQLPEIMPDETVFAVDLSLGDPESIIARLSKYLDAHNHLQDQTKAIRWMQQESVCEVASVCWALPDGSLEKVLMARTGKGEGKDDIPVPNDHAGMLGILFGQGFDLKDESVCARKGDWLISGSIPGVQHILSMEGSLYETLGELEIASVFPAKVCGPMVYFNLAEVPSNALKEPLASSLKRSLAGVSAAPAVLSLQKGGWKLEVERCSRLLPSAARIAASSIDIPKGPFEVTNCGTGKTNLFYQNDNLYLCLKETSGKGLWGVSFDKPICGAVGQVDYYVNGKIQFLFCAGSSLYLIDRLGRFCSGFPVALDKPVLLGPAVYDFNRAKKYNVMVLHTDNTIEMYNLQGRKPASWKGISCPETIVALPVLKKSQSGKDYWEVKTSEKTYTYDFWGGESQKIK